MSKELLTRIQSKYDTYERWMATTVAPLKGEIIIATIPVNATEVQGGNAVTQPPAVVVKVGDGTNIYKDLPFINALAADVHAWAKAAVKPTYKASEIEELDTYIADRSVNIEYQLVADGDNKWKLQSKESGTDSWTDVSTLDMSTVITGLDTRITTLETNSATKAELEAYKTTVSETYLTNDAFGEWQEGSYMDDFDGLRADIDTNIENIGNLQVWQTEKEEVIAGAATRSTENAEAIETLETNVGDVDTLSTENKTVVTAINEVLAAVGTGGTAAVVTITSDVTTDGALKSYTVKQGATTVGVIDIPKDMVVQSGSVVTDPEGQPAGTYIKLILANATNDEIFVNVGTLVDIYNAQANAAQVQLAIDSSTREISATIVAGSITSTELADNAVITSKIADANVTKAKLSATVQASLDLADSAVQESDIESLRTNSHTHTFVESELNKIVDGDVAKWNAAEQNAKDYADGLAGNYATAAQGTKADSAIQTVAAGTGLKATIDETDSTKVTVDIDEDVTFIFNCGDSTSL